MMSPTDKILYQKIDEILWNDWDPIGVNDTPEARDEYHSYIFELIDMKKNRATPGEITNHLHRIEFEHIGLFGELERCRVVAEKIVDIPY